jgi:hypothetical protein
VCVGVFGSTKAYAQLNGDLHFVPSDFPPPEPFQAPPKRKKPAAVQSIPTQTKETETKPTETAPIETETVGENDIEGPVHAESRIKDKRRALLTTAASFGIAGELVLLSAVGTVVAAYVAWFGASVSNSFTCRPPHDVGDYPPVHDGCPEAVSAMDEDLNRRLGIARKIAIPGGFTLAAAAAFAIWGAATAAPERPRVSAKASRKRGSIRPTLSFDSDGFQVGLSLPL